MGSAFFGFLLALVSHGAELACKAFTTFPDSLC